MAAMTGPQPFYTALRGNFSSLLAWDDLDQFWNIVRAQPNGWYIYAVGEPVPTQPSNATELNKFLDAVYALLRNDHREDYCGIVYADDRRAPSLVKIFDPHNLGVSCGFSKNPPQPGWILSRLAPLPLNDPRPLPESRRRWWRALWG